MHAVACESAPKKEMHSFSFLLEEKKPCSVGVTPNSCAQWCLGQALFLVGGGGVMVEEVA